MLPSVTEWFSCVPSTLWSPPASQPVGVWESALRGSSGTVTCCDLELQFPPQDAGGGDAAFPGGLLRGLLVGLRRRSPELLLSVPGLQHQPCTVDQESAP